jgi:hypothetical protein
MKYERRPKKIQMEDNLIFLVNGRRPQFVQMEDDPIDLNILVNRRQTQIHSNRRPQYS